MKEKEKQEQGESGSEKQTYCKRKGRQEATHVPFWDWCAHCMMGRGRTHHHVSKKRSEDLSRR